MNTLEYMIEVRRHLHRFPELSLQEKETAAFIRQQLTDLGYAPVPIADTGTYADFVVDPAKPWLLFRADIDALPVTEETGLPFASEPPGTMHACGHDGHVSMLLGAARAFRLGELTSRFNLRFAFQPAEEMYGGAARMIAAGVLPEHLAGAFGFHIWPQVPYGRLGWRQGTLMASNDRFAITLTGKGAHAAMQNTGRNALQAGAALAAELSRLTTRLLPPNRPGLVFVGTLNAGSGYNIVADRCVLEGTSRALTPEDRDAIEEGIKALSAGIAAIHGVEVSVEYVRQYPPLLTGPEVSAELQKIFPKDLLWEAPEPFMTAEDFAYFTEKVRGGMLLIGSGRGEHPESLHSSRFTFDESLMALGVRAYGILAQGNWEALA